MEAKTETKVERIILKHLTGSRQGQEEPFDLSRATEVTIGRHLTNDVRYDADRDDLVSGNHARIDWSANEPNLFTLTDLGSRNGTFVNNQRVTNPVRVRLGDLIQFGADGPKLEFDCHPRPEGLVKTTRMAAVANAPTVGPTRTGALNGAGSINGNGHSSSYKSGHNSASPLDVAAAPAPGKTTVWNMISNAQQQTRKQMLYGMAAVVAVAALLGWKFWPQPLVLNSGCDPKCVAERFGASTARMDVTWKLISPSGGLVYHQYISNQKNTESKEQWIPGGPAYIALYVKVDGDTIEPFLSYDGNKFSVPIGGAHSGTGFFVSSSGFMLTNRHVAAAWESDYRFPNNASIGYVFAADKKTPLGVIRQAPGDWVPAKTKQELHGSFKGANDKLEVTLNGSSSPVRAELVRVSDRHDVALTKINMPEAAPMVELNDNYDTIREGEAITILGFPAVTAPTLGFIRNAGDLTRQTQVRVIPKITVTPGNVGAILRSSEGKDPTFSQRDVYQLTANATGAGNSGGPVFDTDGKVTGIFYAGTYNGGATVTYAVPIRYGKELMSLK